ncbi:enoyl-CoA hydratase [Marinobacter salexigens]|uniref:Enoyl-CoA hydratase n=1 Tax=Marinobacter salexigens TaxID=1925763 RepID=A0ABS6ABI4_9GAMM|nr:enoyl-CoA hydratase [Marinobacter salexigens]
MTDFIQTELSNQILTVRIKRPERKNALTHAMYTALGDALEQAEADAGIRCVLFTGNEDCFTAGNDLGDFASGLQGAFTETPVGRFLFLLAKATKPVVVSVNGPAVGIGTTMLLHCDMVFAGTNARFQMPFASLGLCPEGGSSLLLPTWLGRVRAAELLMLGGAFSAEDAHRMGLINRICEPAETDKVAQEACQKLASQPPAAIRATKKLLGSPTQEALTTTMMAEGELFAERLKSPEAAEAFSAFMQKRKPDFSRFK